MHEWMSKCCPQSQQEVVPRVYTNPAHSLGLLLSIKHYNPVLDLSTIRFAKLISELLVLQLVHKFIYMLTAIHI